MFHALSGHAEPEQACAAPAAAARRIQAVDHRRAGLRALSKTCAELLFEILSQRYERGSIIVTNNLHFDEWTGVFGDEQTL